MLYPLLFILAHFGVFVDKESIVKQVMDKLDLERIIKNTLELVHKNPSAPKKALDYLLTQEKQGLTTENFSEIFKAIEDKGYIHPTNQNVWEFIYSKFGLQYPQKNS